MKNLIDTDIKIGARVRFVQCVDVYPDAFVEVGETGTFLGVDEEGAYWVKLDMAHNGLQEWDNAVQIWDWSETREGYRPDWAPSASLEVIE
jgi:hypothetical protein